MFKYVNCLGLLWLGYRLWLELLRTAADLLLHPVSLLSGARGDFGSSIHLCYWHVELSVCRCRTLHFGTPLCRPWWVRPACLHYGGKVMGKQAGVLWGYMMVRQGGWLFCLHYGGYMMVRQGWPTYLHCGGHMIVRHGGATILSALWWLHTG